MKTAKLTLLLVLAFVMAASSMIYTFADPNVDALKKEMEEKNKKLKQTQQAINKVQTEKKEVAKQVIALDKKLSQTEEELDSVENQLTGLEAQILITKRDLERATQDADGQRELLKKRVRVMYETGSVGYLSVILESTSFGDFISRVDFLKKIVNYDVELLQNMKTHRDNIAQKKVQLQSEMDQKEKLKQQISNKKEQVASAKADRSKLLSDLTKDLKEYEKQYDQLLEDTKSLAKKIQALSSKGSKYIGGVIEWPVPGHYRITSGYGYRIHPILKKKKLHTGIDIAAPTGTSVVAGNKGTVIFAGYYGGYGYTVIVDHGGQVSTLYAHNSKLLVKEGEKVEKGEAIAKIGSTGLSTGPHLHFEVRENGQHKNPMNYLGK